jgi:uncharacterized protein YndB with AHSA1/START domain
MQPAEVVRSVDLDAGVDEVWEVLCEADGWLADEGELDVREGGLGLLVEQGVARRAVVESVRPGEHLVYRWWDVDGDGTDASRVEIRVVPDGATTRVTVRETHLGASLPIATNCASSCPWSLRLACLGLGCDLARATGSRALVATRA